MGSTLLFSCQKFVDINTNPNGPEKVTANLYLSPMLADLVKSQQFDGRYIGKYVQNWAQNSSADTWDRQGYLANSDAGGEMWRMTYFAFGQNLIDMTNLAEKEQRWDLLGVAYVLKAIAWQYTTDASGELILKQAFDVSRNQFDYDAQQEVYTEIERLLKLAIIQLKRTDGAVDAAFLSRTDLIYRGDRVKWLKFAYGLLAMHKQRLSNKVSMYNPDDVMKYVDSSFSSNADDALMRYTGIQNDDTNFFGTRRNNITNFRQTDFIVNLMNGTILGGGVDPRISRILAPSPDGSYRGITPTLGYGNLTPAQRPNNLFGYVTLPSPSANASSKYLFHDQSNIPLMSYAQMQFIKAEAAFLKGNKTIALDAFRKGVSAHIDFVNSRNQDNPGNAVVPISATEKTAFMASAAVPSTEATLTLSHIMLQKYICEFAWQFFDTWSDMRRYHYTDLDPATGTQVYKGLSVPTNLFPDNQGKLVYRLRPRYNSEYVWNRASLDKIGGLSIDYHTKELWFSQKN